MKIDFMKALSSWKDAYSSALTTVGKNSDREPSTSWKTIMLQSEHSPIRRLRYSLRLSDLPYWVSVHFVRHKFGVEHFVSTQREDRTGNERGSQEDPVTHEMELNAQAMINISRRRLCRLASFETQEAWSEVVAEVMQIDQELGDACVPECVYRGFCYEMKSCGFYNTSVYRNWLSDYRETIIKQREAQK